MTIYTYDANTKTVFPNSIENNRIQGKKITAIGDSYVKGNGLSESDTWLARIANRNGMTATNLGQNARSLQEMVVAEAWKNIPNNTDYIVIWDGHNDSNYKLTPLGTLGDTTSDTFYGCLDILCKGIMNRYPTARILFITPSKRSVTGNNVNAYQYVDAMKEVCAKYDIPCWDSFREMGILINNMEGVDEQAEFEQKKNGSYMVHLNAIGHEYLSYKIEEQLKML